MREISSHFCIIKPELIQKDLLIGKPIKPTADMLRYASRGKVVFSQDPETGDNGLSYRQTFRAVVKDSDVMEYNGCNMYVGVFRSDGSMFVIGSATEVPVLVVVPYENVFSVETTFDSLSPAVL